MRRQSPQVAGGIYANLGAAFQAMGNCTKAIGHFEKAKDIAQASDDSSLSSVLANLGNAYQVALAFPQACSCAPLYGSVTIDKVRRRLTNQLGKARSRVCAVQATGESQQALVIHSQAASHARKMQNWTDEGRAYGQIGSICIACNQYDDAIKYFKQALSCAYQAGSDASAMMAFGRLGLSYFMLSRLASSTSTADPTEKLQTATRMFQQQHVLASKLGDLETLGHCWYLLEHDLLLLWNRFDLRCMGQRKHADDE